METEKISISLNHFELSDKSPAVIAEVSGRIDASTSVILEEQLAKLLRDKYYHLGLHLGELKYINSTGMGLLLQYAEQFIAQGGSFCLLVIPQKIKTLFSMLGIMTVFQTLESVSAYQDYAEELIKSRSSQAINQKLLEQKQKELEEKEEKNTEKQSKQDGFPVVFACPSCKGKITIPKYGYFRCARCHHCFHIDKNGERLANVSANTHSMQINIPCRMDSMRGIDDLITNFLGSYDFSQPDILSISKVFEELGTILVEKTYNWGDNLNLFVVCTSTEFRAIVSLPSQLFRSPGEENTNINFQLMQKMMNEVELVRFEGGGQLIQMMKKLG